jgi:hypothetical protein
MPAAKKASTSKYTVAETANPGTLGTIWYKGDEVELTTEQAQQHLDSGVLVESKSKDAQGILSDDDQAAKDQAEAAAQLAEQQAEQLRAQAEAAGQPQQ